MHKQMNEQMASCSLPHTHRHPFLPFSTSPLYNIRHFQELRAAAFPPSVRDGGGSDGGLFGVHRRHRVRGVAVVRRGKRGRSAVEGEGKVDVLYFSALASKVGEVVQRARRQSVSARSGRNKCSEVGITHSGGDDGGDVEDDAHDLVQVEDHEDSGEEVGDELDMN
jgi:hypothetical protein